MTRVTRDGKIESSGKGLDGLLQAFRSLAEIFTVELPRLLANLARIGK